MERQLLMQGKHLQNKWINPSAANSGCHISHGKKYVWACVCEEQQMEMEVNLKHEEQRTCDCPG